MSESAIPVKKEALDDVLAGLRGEYPNARLFQILVPEREDDVFIARKLPWMEYSKLLGAVKNEATGMELIVQKCLLHPHPDYTAMQTDVDFWTPGLIITLANQIQRAHGVVAGASVKNV